MEPSDVDDSHVVGRVWYLNANREDSYANLRKLLARDKANVVHIILLLRGQSLKDSQNHVHERPEHLCLLQDTLDHGILSRQLELVFSEHVIQSKDVRVQLNHYLNDRLVESLHADSDSMLVNSWVHQAEHGLGQHEAALHGIGRWRLAGIVDELENILQDFDDVVVQAVDVVLLIPVEYEH